jgi:tRNA(adenine34) deaminase
MLIPAYLAEKLNKLQLNSVKLIRKYGYLEIYAQLKITYPSINFQPLYALYCISQGSYPYVIPKDKQQELILKYKSLSKRHVWLPAASINHYLNAAEQQALKAVAAQEIPIGAVIVYQDKIIAQAYNQTRSKASILAHAEIEALQQAEKILGNFRLPQCDLYVTIEPCLMCSGAIINSRIRRLVFGALEPKSGAYHSQLQVFTNKSINHNTHVIGPIDQTHYSMLLQQFLKQRRQ